MAFSFHMAQSASSPKTSRDVIKHIVSRRVDVRKSQKATSVFERGPGFWTTPEDEQETVWYKKLTPPKSQREHWYQVTPYVAEFWCTLSSLGFIYVGIEQQCPELIVAGCGALLTHTIPKNSLVVLDKITALTPVISLLCKFDVSKQPLWLTGLVLSAGLVKGIDTLISERIATTIPHVFWHLYAAFVARTFLLNGISKGT